MTPSPEQVGQELERYRSYLLVLAQMQLRRQLQAKLDAHRFTVLHEEVDELWDHVKTKPSRRMLSDMRAEAIQVAAMALRFVVDICNEERGRR